MQVVVGLDRLVGDDQVVGVVGQDVVQDHEVRGLDLVHAAQRVEGVQVVAVRF